MALDSNMNATNVLIKTMQFAFVFVRFFPVLIYIRQLNHLSQIIPFLNKQQKIACFPWIVQIVWTMLTMMKLKQISLKWWISMQSIGILE